MKRRDGKGWEGVGCEGNGREELGGRPGRRAGSSLPSPFPSLPSPVPFFPSYPRFPNVSNISEDVQTLPQPRHFVRALGMFGNLWKSWKSWVGQKKRDGEATGREGKEKGEGAACLPTWSTFHFFLPHPIPSLPILPFPSLPSAVRGGGKGRG